MRATASAGDWFLALLLTGLAAGVSAMTVRWVEQSPPRREPGRVAALAVAAADALTRPADPTRGLWSPDLFALPTRLGFSGFGNVKESRADVPLDLPPDDPRFRDREKTSVFEGAVVQETPPSVSAPAPWPSRVQAPPSGRRWLETVEASGLTGSESFSFPLDQAECGSAAWSLVLNVGFDADGGVDQMLIEGELPAGVSEIRLRRGVEQWRLAAGPSGRWIRARLTFEGRAP